MLKALYLFYRTFRYLAVSYLPGADLLRLKKQWAEEMAAFFGVKIEARGRAPAQAPVILVGNHISYLDIIVLMAVHPRVVFLAKKEVGTWPVIGPTARRVDTLFVDRSSKDKQQVRRDIARQLQELQAHLVVFPSGTTTLHEELPWKKGMFEIAQEHGIPVQAFKVSYSHPRLCAYIGEDSMLRQMRELFRVPGKKAYFEWLEVFHPQDPEVDAEKVRKHVVEALERVPSGVNKQ